MSQIKKKVNRLIPVRQRSQIFTNADATQGDIILVKDSLGKTAATIQIEADALMQVRFNVLHTMYPPRDQSRGWMLGTDPGIFVASGIEVTDTSMDPVTIAANETFTLDHDLSVNDIQLVTVSGVFEIFVS